MWGLGVVIYLLLTGSFPFKPSLFDDKRGQNVVGHPKMTKMPTVLREQAVNYKDPIWRDHPLAQDFVQQCLKIQPKERPSSREALKHPWIAGLKFHPRVTEILRKKMRLCENVLLKRDFGRQDMGGGGDYGSATATPTYDSPKTLSLASPFPSAAKLIPGTPGTENLHALHSGSQLAALGAPGSESGNELLDSFSSSKNQKTSEGAAVPNPQTHEKHCTGAMDRYFRSSLQFFKILFS